MMDNMKADNKKNRGAVLLETLLDMDIWEWGMLGVVAVCGIVYLIK